MHVCVYSFSKSSLYFLSTFEPHEACASLIIVMKKKLSKLLIVAARPHYLSIRVEIVKCQTVCSNMIVVRATAVIVVVNALCV